MQTNQLCDSAQESIISVCVDSKPIDRIFQVHWRSIQPSVLCILIEDILLGSPRFLSLAHFFGDYIILK